MTRAFTDGNDSAGLIATMPLFFAFLLLVIPLSVGGNALPQSDHLELTQSKGSVAQPTMGQHLKAKGIPNFGQVTPMLYRGGQPSAEGFETLAHMEIAIIVDTGRSKRDARFPKIRCSNGL